LKAKFSDKIEKAVSLLTDKVKLLHKAG